MNSDSDNDSLQRELDLIEQKIYTMENDYLKQAPRADNVGGGEADGLKCKPVGHRGPKLTKHRGGVDAALKAKDRVFSLSSCTSRANIDLKREVEVTPCEALSGKNEDPAKRGMIAKVNGIEVAPRRSTRKVSGRSSVNAEGEHKPANGGGIHWDGEDGGKGAGRRGRRADVKNGTERSKKIRKNGCAN